MRESPKLRNSRSVSPDSINVAFGVTLFNNAFSQKVFTRPEEPWEALVTIFIQVSL